MTEYLVSLTGDDRNSGSFGQPLRTIAKAALVAVKPADRVIVRAGTYHEPVRIAGKGTPEAPIRFQAEQKGQAIISAPVKPHGTWNDDGGPHTVNPWVTFSGLQFYGGYDPAGDVKTSSKGPDAVGYGTQLRMSLGWRAEFCTFTGGAQTGANIRGDAVTIAHCMFTELSTHAIVSANTTDVQITDTLIRKINRAGLISPEMSAVTKFLATKNLLIERVVSEHNMGKGLWLDTRNVNTIIRGCTIRNNVGRTRPWEASGIMVEINTGPCLIEDNAISVNTGYGILIAESTNTTIRGNTLRDGINSLALRNDGRLPGIGSIIFEGNACYKPSGAIINAADKRLSTVDPRSFRVQGNRYTRVAGQPYVDWMGTLAQSTAEMCQLWGWECS
jgi:parallel beta-helix repeat protein